MSTESPLNLQKIEYAYWGLALVAAVYLLSGWTSTLARQDTSSLARLGTVSAETQSSPSGGHYMPNGQWMADGTMGGMACSMGGGCGCGH